MPPSWARLYRTLYRLSDGAMTPLIGGSLEHLGYDAGYSLRPGGAPLAAPRWEDVLEWDGTRADHPGPRRARRRRRREGPAG